MAKGTRYPAEFKAEAVSLYRASARPQREIASELGIAPGDPPPLGGSGRHRRRFQSRSQHRGARGAPSSAPGGPHPSHGAGPAEKIRGLLRPGVRPDPIVIFRFIRAEKANFPVAFVCAKLGVSRSGYYAWRSRPPSTRTVHDQVLTCRIRLIHQRSRCTYGAPRIWAELRDDGVRVGRKRVARLMRAEEIRGAYRRPRRGRRGHATFHPAGDLLGRNFCTKGPDLVWVADITYWPTGEGFLHIAAVMDLWSRRIVGWAMASHLRAELVIDALEMATSRRRPSPGLIHHSDQGSQSTRASPSAAGFASPRSCRPWAALAPRPTTPWSRACSTR